MFKSYSLAALAAVASAQYGHHGLSYSDHIPHKPHGDGFDDGYAKDVFHNHLHSGRRHQTLDLDDEKHAPHYGARKDLRREDADIDTNKESPDYRHENGDHQNQEYGEKDVRNDDDLDARGTSGLTGGSRHPDPHPRKDALRHEFHHTDVDQKHIVGDLHRGHHGHQGHHNKHHGHHGHGHQGHQVHHGHHHQPHHQVHKKPVHKPVVHEPVYHDSTYGWGNDDWGN